MSKSEVTRTTAEPATDTRRTSSLNIPSTNPATNLLIADIVVRGVSSLFRKGVEKRVVEKSSETAEQARQVLDGRGILTTLGLYGASKLATRSPMGLGIVAGGLVLKTLYDRGKTRQKRLRENGSRD
ncbi:hypothetical protein [Erythrobacter crassostreae]|uniref:Uncharacterized protein n=1 Tax=Erythrobacter crassostreae TaxID=2828328 RepID=A0A9X1JL68_9SPHN|nr:hypothetical protein [Erythrobacter crassostrea]MBV7258009.1 hypothetical protein [Erythrobacter crassostrea]